MAGRASVFLVAVLATAGVVWAGVPPQSAYVKAPNADAGDGFGVALAVSGNTMVVGAPFESGDASSTLQNPNENTLGAGAVYVYVWNGSAWVLEAYLKASNPGEFDLFGGEVAISGDTIVVGAATESGDASATVEAPNDSADAAGAAYVFERSGSTWTQTAYLKAGNLDERDLFGASVAISGDTIVVGAWGEEGNQQSTSAAPNDLAPGAGAVYVFERDGAGWAQTAYLKASNAGMDDRFGHAVAICGDCLITGAWSERGDAGSTVAAPNNAAAFAGAAYLFERDPASRVWTQAAYLKASNAEAEDQFGVAVAISGDTAIVGAVFEDGDGSSTAAAPNNAAENAGAVYVFERGDTGWGQSAYLKGDPAVAHFGFGAGGLAIQGGTLVAGAPGEDPLPDTNSPSGQGAVYVFNRIGAGWSAPARIEASNPDGNEVDDDGFLNAIGDQFGYVTALWGGHLVVGAGAESGDSASTAGAPNNDAPGAGAVYGFSLPPPRLTSLSVGGDGVSLTVPVPEGVTIGVEYSPDLGPGSWSPIGEFVDPESDGLGTFLDSETSRTNRGGGFYRGAWK